MSTEAGNEQRQAPAGAPAAAGGSGAAGMPPSPDEGAAAAGGDGAAASVSEELARAEARAEEYLQTLQRLKADFDNYRRRVSQDQARWGEAALAAFIGQLLPVVDNLERAAAASGDLESVRQGVAMTLRQLQEVLRGVGVEAMQSVGQVFDPERHEAVARAAVPGVAEGAVVEEYRRGYVMRGAVLRPALVKVAVAESGAAAETGDGAAPAMEAADVKEGKH